MTDNAPIIVFDVDGTVANGRPVPEVRARPGIHLTMRILEMLNYELHLWSGNGARYAWEVANYLGLPIGREHCHSKPLHMSYGDAWAELGFRERHHVALTVDDNPEDAVGNWPFFHVDSWWREPIDAAVSDALNQSAESVARLAEITEVLRETYAQNDGDDHQRALDVASRAGYQPANCRACGRHYDECWAVQARKVLNGS